VHGKVSLLVIKIPLLHILSQKTTVEIEGVHLLIVPSSNVKYDEQKEIEEEQEAKQLRLQVSF
jgi:hypothetical protein